MLGKLYILFYKYGNSKSKQSIWSYYGQINQHIKTLITILFAVIGVCCFFSSIHKKLPMKFKVWERRLKEHMDIWYLTIQDEELQMVSFYGECQVNLLKNTLEWQILF